MSRSCGTLAGMHSDTDPAVSHPVATTPTRRWWSPLLAGDLAALWPAIVVAFLGVLVIAFGMSFHGLYAFGDRVMDWAMGLCIAGPIGLDVFSLLCLIATFLTRDAPLHIRAYCWAALLAAVAASIGGNAISAYAALDAVAARRNADVRWGYREVSAIVWAAFWPLLSAVALHVLIVVRRHLDERRDSVRQAVEEAEQEAADEQLLQARALVLAAEGATASAIVSQLGLEESRQRSVERWTKPVRDALAARPAVAAAKPTTRRQGRPEGATA